MDNTYRLGWVIFFLGLIASTPSLADEVAKVKAKGQVEKPAKKELSCAKQARRIHKIKDKMERREFIRECRAKRAAREQAERDKKAAEKAQKKAAEEKLLRGILE